MAPENEEEFEEVTELDLVYEAHDKIDALIDLLIEKGVISESEYERKLEEYYDMEDEEE